MHTLLLFLLVFAIVFAINVVPAFMPPSWSVMAVFHVTAGLALFPLTIGGAAMSALGRMVLALLSARFKNLLPESDRRNAEALGGFVNRHRRWREVIFFGYCLAPLPSNPLFIAAGAGKMPLLPVTIAFFLSRAIADTFWVWTAGKITKSVGGVFVSQLTSWKAIAAQVGGIVLVVLVFRLPWAKWLGVSPGDEKQQGRESGQKEQACSSRSPGARPRSRSHYQRS